jgi:fucose permease
MIRLQRRYALKRGATKRGGDMARHWFALSIWTMAVFGAFDMLRGLAAPLMQQAWQIDYAALGAVFAAGAAGYLAGTFLTGLVVERAGLRPVTVIGALLLVLGTCGVVTSHRYGWAFGSFLCAGLGSGILEVGVNAVVPATAHGAEAQARRFNLLHGAYGAGAFAFPLAAGLCIAQPGAWRALYAVLGAATAVVAAWAAMLPALAVASGCSDDAAAASGLPAGEGVSKTSADTLRTAPSQSGQPHSHSVGDGTRWWAHPLLWALLVAIFAYVMAEVGLATWVPTYLLRVRGVPLTLGSYLLSGFYLWFTLGRLTAPWWLTRLGPRRALAAALMVSLGAVLWLLLPLPGAAWALWLAGLGFASVFPTVTALASDIFSRQAGRVLGLLFTAAGVGGLWTNLLIGGLAQRWGIRAGMALVLAYLGVTAGALAAAQVQRIHRWEAPLESQPGSR